jgi:hypothetical protein
MSKNIPQEHSERLILARFIEGKWTLSMQLFFQPGAFWLYKYERDLEYIEEEDPEDFQWLEKGDTYVFKGKRTWEPVILTDELTEQRQKNFKKQQLVFERLMALEAEMQETLSELSSELDPLG